MYACSEIEPRAPSPQDCCGVAIFHDAELLVSVGDQVPRTEDHHCTGGQRFSRTTAPNFATRRLNLFANEIFRSHASNVRPRYPLARVRPHNTDLSSANSSHHTCMYRTRSSRLLDLLRDPSPALFSDCVCTCSEICCRAAATGMVCVSTGGRFSLKGGVAGIGPVYGPGTLVPSTSSCELCQLWP